MKTSITLDENILERIEEYRKHQKEIPTRSNAINALLCNALKEYDTVPKKVKEPKISKVAESKIPIVAGGTN